MSARPLHPEHPDYDTLRPLVEKLVDALGAWEDFVTSIPPLFRLAIDEVIDAPRTGRLTLDEIEKTEKTYLGTKIEILLRNKLKFRSGNRLDLNIDGQECDIKNTMGRTWSIPSENIGYPAILLREDESKSVCDFGLILIRPDYLNSGRNRDGKGSISSASLQHVWWLLKDHPYPPNIWQTMETGLRARILAEGSPTRSIAMLFEQLQETPIPRTAIEALGTQRDPLKRIRRNGGARDILAPKGIAILFEKNDRDLIAGLGIGPIGPEEFISFAPKTPEQEEILRSAGHID